VKRRAYAMLPPGQDGWRRCNCPQVAIISLSLSLSRARALSLSLRVSVCICFYYRFVGCIAYCDYVGR